mmetsp:Transcript_127203/g.368305  ORF Transcript_127203/g.368305 Transcript_127203/m.368305 type:complete len:203 (-) Transcript_127203:1047-1655(-)
MSSTRRLHGGGSGESVSGLPPAFGRQGCEPGVSRLLAVGQAGRRHRSRRWCGGHIGGPFGIAGVRCTLGFGRERCGRPRADGPTHTAEGIEGLCAEARHPRCQPALPGLFALRPGGTAVGGLAFGGATLDRDMGTSSSSSAALPHAGPHRVVAERDRRELIAAPGFPRAVGPRRELLAGALEVRPAGADPGHYRLRPEGEHA